MVVDMWRVTNIRLLVVWAILTLPGLVHAQSNYPGAALFRYECQGDGLQFYHQDVPVIQVHLSDVAAPLAAAINTRQNQPITNAGEISLWALQSNELQIHRNADPDGTKLVLSANICGEILSPAASPAAGSVALAYVQLDGPGRALALAAVTASGQVAAYAQVWGSGYALALAQSGAAANGGAVHIVQPGENLFRIALRYGTTVGVLAVLNHISNPRLIYVGQTLVVP